MNEHPDFQRAVKKNPDRMMHKAQEQRERDVEHHQQQREKGKPAAGNARQQHERDVEHHPQQKEKATPAAGEAKPH
jgi:hypothetical protein